MSVDSDAFEALVERIIVLSRDGAENVRRDDHVKDPDNPRSSRQVDISFDKHGKKVFVECRKHATPQDVKWVEELIGRKISLRPDQMIGVSSSGFTKLAKIKAEAHGIILREVGELRDEEILSWGTFVVAEVFFVKYQNLTVSLDFKGQVVADGHPAIQKLLVSGGHYANWLTNLALKIKEQLTLEHLVPIEVELLASPAFILNEIMSKVAKITLNGVVSLHSIKYSLSAAKTSLSSNKNYSHLVHVFEYGASGTELHLSDETFAWAIDFSKVCYDRDCFPAGDFRLDMGQPRAIDRAYICGLSSGSSIMTLPTLIGRVV